MCDFEISWTTGQISVIWFLAVPFTSEETVRIPLWTGALHVDWVFSPYLIAWVFPIGVFPSTSLTEHFCSFPIHPAIDACTVGCVKK